MNYFQKVELGLMGFVFATTLGCTPDQGQTPFPFPGSYVIPRGEQNTPIYYLGGLTIDDQTGATLESKAIGNAISGICACEVIKNYENVLEVECTQAVSGGEIKPLSGEVNTGDVTVCEPPIDSCAENPCAENCAGNEDRCATVEP